MIVLAMVSGAMTLLSYSWLALFALCGLLAVSVLIGIATRRKGKRNYSAYLPDLPGCVAAGKTLKQTQRLIREAVELHLQGMREDGEKIPQPTCIAGYLTVAD